VTREYPHSAQRERRAFTKRAPYERAIEWRNRGHTGAGDVEDVREGVGERQSVGESAATAATEGASLNGNDDASGRDGSGERQAPSERICTGEPDRSGEPDGGEDDGSTEANGTQEREVTGPGANLVEPVVVVDAARRGKRGRRRIGRRATTSFAPEGRHGEVGISPRHRHRRAGILVIAAVSVLCMGAGAFAAFFDSASSTVSVGAGEVEVEWSTSVSASLAVPIPSILPGQSIERLVELRNTGSISISDLQLVIAAATADNSDGLQLMISDCSVPWSGTTSFTCGGVETVVSADRPVRAVIALPTLGAHSAGGSDFIRMSFRLPTSAPVGLQYSSTTVNFEILGNHDVGGQR
jgi:spore coat-associated protein N